MSGTSLRARIVLLLLGVILPTLSLFLYSAHEQRQTAAEELQQELITHVELLSGVLEQKLEGARSLLTSLAHSQAIRDRDAAACSSLLAHILEHNPQYTNLGVTDPDGNVFCSALPMKEPINAADKAWFQRTLASRDIAFGDYQIGRIVNKPVIIMGYAARDQESDELRAAIFVPFDLSRLSKIPEQLDLPQGAAFLLLDRNGTILTRSPDHEKWVGKTMTESEIIKTVLARQKGVTEVAGVDGVRRIQAFAPVAGTDNSLYISIGVPRDSALAGINRQFRRNLLLFGLVAGLSLAVALVISRLAKKSEEDLQTIKNRLNLLLTSSPAAIYSCSTSGDYGATFVSANVKNQLGYEPHEFTENSAFWISHIHPEDRSRVLSDLAQLFKQGFHSHEYRFRHSDGSYRWMYDECRLIIDETETGKSGEIVGYWVDITDRKKADEQIRILAALVDLAPAAIMVHDLAGKVIFVNQTTLDMHGYTREEYLTLNLHDIDAPESAALIESRIQQLLAMGSASFEVAHYRKDRTIIPLLVFAKLADWEGQKVLFGIASDLTERKQREWELKEAHDFLASVLEGIGEGVVVIDRDYRIISANRGYCRQAKMPPEEIVGKYCYEVSHHYDRPCHEKAGGCECTVVQCFETGKHHRAIHTHYDALKNPLYVETNAYPLRESSGKVISVIETLADVTERVRLEKTLETVKERYRKLYDHAPDMMHSVNKDGIITICNETEAKILGYDKEELQGQPLTTIVASDSMDASRRKVEALKGQGVFAGELILVAKDGKRIPVAVSSTAMYDEAGGFLMSDTIMRDISEKKGLENQLRHAQKMEAIGTLAGGIAHDFNNLLNIIIGYGGLMQMQLPPDDPQLPQLREILSAGQRAAQLTRSLLAFSRKQVMETKIVPLNAIVEGFKKMLGRIIGEDIELKLVQSEQDLTVEADIVQIEQVLMNLATNARDAMPRGGALTIATEPVDIDTAFVKAHGYGQSGRYALITVSDSGTGMDEKTQERIFEPFFTTKELGKGTGLGLAIVYGIVKQHNGYINCYSEAGKGTTFKIYIPLLKTAAEGIEAAETVLPSGGMETILVAEDDAAVRTFVKQLLEKFGYTVIEAVDGEAAVEKYRTNRKRIQLLLFDIIMPKKNGKDAYEDIIGMGDDVKAIFISGYARDIVQKYGIDEGVDFITKPVPPNELLRKIRQQLDKGGKS